MPDNRELFVFIVGCGRLGAYLASSLSREGHSVVAIDVNADAFASLAADYGGFRVEGDATELETLRNARLDRADLLIAATRRDNVNVLVAQVARHVFGVPRVMARVFDAEREEVYRSLGIETLCPTLIAGDRFLQLLHLPQESEGRSV